MQSEGKKIVATNRQARREFEIFDSFEAGMVLTGSEVKSLRNAQAQIKEAYCRIHDGEIWLNSCHISRYEHASTAFSHEPDRPKKLLLNKKELKKLEKEVKNSGLTIVPLKLFINDKGFAKLRISLAKGKKLFDKRETIKDRDNKRDLDRVKKNFK